MKTDKNAASQNRQSSPQSESPSQTDSPAAKPKSPSLRYKLPSLLWFLIIMVLLSLPGESFPEITFWNYDKIAHALMFGMQAFLFWIALELPVPIYKTPKQSAVTAFILVSLFGALSEVYQHFFTSRLAGTGDIIANLIGAGLFLLAVTLVKPKRVIDLARSIFSPSHSS